MMTRSSETTKQYLESVILPVYTTGKYTVISHKHIMDTALKLLGDNNLVVDKELYAACQLGEVARAVYYIKDTTDPEMGMMFAWANSYDKSMKFKCAIGGYGTVSQNTCITGNLSSWGRKHTGTALEEATKMIEHQILNAQVYFTELLNDKRKMSNVFLSSKNRAEILGRLIFEKGVLTSDQIGIIRAEITKPSFDYGSTHSLWSLYNHISHSIKRIHPRFWMDKQRQIHWFFINEIIGTTQTISGIPDIQVVTPNDQVIVQDIQNQMIGPVSDVFNDPKQLDLEEVIREVELEKVSKDDEVYSPHLDPSPFYEDTEEDEIKRALRLKELEEELKEEEINEDLEEELDIENSEVDEEKTMERANPETYEKVSILSKEEKKVEEEYELTPEQLAKIEENTKAFLKKDEEINFNL